MLNLESVRTILAECKSAKETIKKIWRMDEDTQHKVWILLWRWWSARKKINTGEKKLPTQEIVSLVTFYVTKFEKLKKEGS